MRIGIDGGCLANRRGFGRFARQTLSALAAASHDHELVVLVDRPSAETVAVPERCERRLVEVAAAPSRAASSTGRRSLGDLFAMSRAAARSRLDLLYFPATYSFFPVWNVPRVIVTMHDTLAVSRPDLVFPSRAGRIAWAVKEHLAVHTADRILTVSEAARSDLLAWFRLPESRIGVVTEGPEAVFGPRPHGAASDLVLRRYGVDPRAPFFLYVGGLSPHKNLTRLIAAFAATGLRAEGHRLILIGDIGDVFHSHVPELRAAIEAHGLSHDVLMTGFVPDADLAFFYNRATALVQPSLLEGFGLPPVEAMACGSAVLASQAGSLPEVVGDAGLFFDPTDESAIAKTLRSIVDQPWRRLELQANARARAGRFTWEAAAHTLLQEFEALAPRRRHSRFRNRRMSA